MSKPLAAPDPIQRIFGTTQFQVNWQTATLAMTSVNTGAQYPILRPGGADSRYAFATDSVLMGVYFSVSWLTAAADETSCIAVSASHGGSIRATGGGNGIIFQTTLTNWATAGANQVIQRNPGFMFSPPFVKFLPPSSSLQLYASNQGSIKFSVLASLYFIPLPDYTRLMSLAL